MRIKSLFMAFLAGALALVACKKEQNPNDLPPSITVTPGSVEFDQSEGSKKLEVNATRAWTVSGIPDWVALTPTSGAASVKAAEVVISVLANSGNDREATLTFSIGLAKQAVTVKQKGAKGEYVTPTVTCAEFIQTDGVTEYIISGKVTSMNSEYKYAYISDGTAEVEVYKPSNWEDYVDKIKVGATLKAQGVYTKYTNASGKTYDELVGVILEVIEAQKEDPSNVEQITCAEFIQKADQNTVYRLVGEVTSDVNTSYCSFDMNDGTATVVVWTVNNKDEWKDVVKKGGTVTVRGKYQPYTDKNGNLKHEMVDAYIEDFKAGGTPNPGSDDKPSGNGTLDSPYNPKAAYDIAAALASDAKSDDVYITGKISSIKYTFSAEYGTATFNISEDGSTSGTQLPCYSVYYLGNRAWVDGDTQVAVGDKVIIYGKLTNYQGNTPETASKSAYIYSLNGSTGGDTPGPGPGPDPGDAIAVTVAEFIAAAESETQVYQLTGTIGGTINSTYGNFDLTDDSGTVYVYGLTATNLGYGASNDKSYASLGLAAGDKIVIKGYRGSYGEKVEVVYAWFVEKVSGGDPGPGPEPGGDFTSNVTWTAGSDNSYDQDATVNGTTGVKVLKLGKGSDYGKSTLTLPAGSTTLSFYAVSWNNADVANLVFSVNGQEVATVTPKANSGLAGNPTYTLTVSDSDHYTVDLGSATTTVEVKTAGGYRAALFGIIAK